MAISKSRYVLITSGVGGEAVAGRRELIARVMTTNTLAPTDSILEFGGGATTALKNVGIHFGTTSAEYAFASKYFGYISKDAIQPNKISFARYSLEATAPQLISTQVGQLAQLKAIANGSFKISMGGVSTDLTGINLTAVNSLSEVATAIQDAIQGYGDGGALFTGATVTFTNGAFVLTGGSTGSAVITVAEPATEGTDISSLIGWSLATNPVVSVGMDSETLSEALSRILNTNDNFGSFCFLTTLTTEQITEVAQWTNAQNVSVLYSQAVTSSNYAEIQTAVNGLNGVGLTLNNSYMPMSILASVNYDNPNAATNYMYNSFPSDVPSVTSDTMADTYDKVKVNYLGATQQAGKLIAFYQRGVLQGDISDMGVYCNEMWLKDAISTDLLNMFLALKQIPANNSGKATVRSIMVPVCESAKLNGVIQVGKELTSVQKAYITSLTGDNEVWREVEQSGYTLDIDIVQTVNANNGLTEYKVDYTLIYSKGDSIKSVTGTNILV